MRGRDGNADGLAAHADEAGRSAGAGGGGGGDHDPGRRAEPRIVLRPLANPLPLGFLALAAGTLLLAGLQLGWLGAEEGQSVALALLAFVFPLQLIACVFGYLCRDVVAGTGMGVLSGAWLTI